MNFSQTGIANMSLQRLGARGNIASINDGTPNANKVLVVWDMVFQEVLSERDWKFAKTRVQLQQNASIPAGGYLWAYALPADFLRLVKPREIPEERRIPDYSVFWGSGYGSGRSSRDLPVWPRMVDPYVVETVLTAGSNPASYTTNLLTNYPGCNTPYANVCPITINYIRLITDYTQLLPGFVNCFANRLAAELAIPITEDSQKYEGMMEMYLKTLNSAQAQQECDDFLESEAGSQTWVEAGRYWGRR